MLTRHRKEYSLWLSRLISITKTSVAGRPASGYRNPKRLGQATQSLYVDVRGIDEHFRRARKAGAVILEEPSDTNYGNRRYGAADPEGHEWYFAQVIRRPKSKRKAR